MTGPLHHELLFNNNMSRCLNWARHSTKQTYECEYFVIHGPYKPFHSFNKNEVAKVYSDMRKGNIVRIVLKG